MKSKLFISLLPMAVLFAGATFSPAANLLAPGYAIVGVAATPGSAVSTISSAGTGANQYPAAEPPPNSIDANTGTKYLNFSKINCGFIVTIPNGLTTVNGFIFSTANDAVERDPTVVTLEGTSASDPTAAAAGSTWVTIYSGPSGLATDPGRLTAGTAIAFPAAGTFNTYRMLITDVRNQSTANSMQFSEIQFMGQVGVDTNPPTLVSVSPTPGTVEAPLSAITVRFSEPVVGVNASDLLINGTPASGVSGGGTNYVFTFPPLPLGTAQVAFANSPGITDFGIPPNSFNETNVTWQYVVVDTTAPFIVARSPSGLVVNQLDAIQVNFSEPVTGVDAGDLLINGVPATNLLNISPSIFTFGFAPPPTGAVTVAFAPGHGIVDAGGNAFAGLMWNYTLDSNATALSFYISEFLASNSGHGTNGIRDEDGDTSDWIEIYNTDTVVRDIGGWFLTDTTNNLVKWRFPAGVTIPGRGYLIVYASAKNRTNILGKLHTNFQLNGGGEYLALVNPETNIISQFSPIFPPQTIDISYGRDQANPNIVGYFQVPTPGGGNSFGEDPGLAVNFSRGGGTFAGSFQLTLSTANTNNRIYYNLVSSAQDANSATNIPGTNATLYTVPITISNTLQLRARAFPAVSSNSFPSAPRTECYILVGANITNFVSPLPIVILHTLNTASLSGGYPSVDNSINLVVIDNDLGPASILGTPQLAKRTGINLRGSSTQGFPKSSYAVELWDEFNNDEEASFAGLPKESDWVLYAPNQFDNVLIHNPLMHQFAIEMGYYSSRTRFVEVFFHNGPGALSATTNSTAGGMGDYNGVYVLEEKVKRDGNRVNIDVLAPEQTNATVITGGYLVKIDRTDGNERAFTGGGVTIVYQEPDGLEMVTAARAPQANYIKAFFDNFNTGLTGNALTNVASTNHYSNYLDVDTTIDLHIANVLTLNVDGYRLSGYIYKPRGGKMVWGPLWDCDRGQGTTKGDGRAFNPRCWQASNPSGTGGTDNGTDFFQGSTAPFWLGRLFADIDFWQRWIDRYQEYRATVLDTNHINANIDFMASQLREAQVREVKRWAGSGSSDTGPRNGLTTSFNGDYSHTFNGTYQGEIDFQKRWYSDRIDFMDTNFLNRPSLSLAEGQVALGTLITLTDNSGKAGTRIYYTLDGSDPRGFQGTINPAAILYTGPFTVTNNVRVHARATNPNHNNMTGITGISGAAPQGTRNPVLSSKWSGDKAATYYITTPLLVITELMFHPAPSASPSDTNDVDNFEYIELKNIGSNALNLVGFKFTNGINFTFVATNGVTNLAPGGYVLIVKNFAAFTNRYGLKTNIAGVYGGTLDNGGERITLVGPQFEPILDFTYSDGWYPLADGQGFSLVIIDENAPLNTWGDKNRWRISAVENGSPGVTDPPAPHLPVILVNEALTHTLLPQLDTIELFNPGTNDVDIGGWYLTDDPNNPKKYQIPTNTMILAGGFLLFDETDFNTGPTAAFALDSNGDDVYLFSAANGLLTGYAHGFDFGAAPLGVAFGRYVTSEGNEDFVAQSVTNTLGAPNAPPLIGPIVIAEVMYHPPDGLSGTNLLDNSLDEFIELYNITTNAVPLYNTNTPSHTWHLSHAVSFNFPTNVSLAGNSRVLVVNFDPATNAPQLAAFRAKYGVATNIPLYGPYDGKLDNSSGNIHLTRPDTTNLDGSVPHILVDRVEYKDSGAWPVAADGTGASLQRRVLTAYGNDPTNWLAAAATAGAFFQGGGTPPAVTQQPANAIALLGGTTNFIAAVSGAGVRVQWRFNGSLIPGATNSTLTLSNFQYGSAGLYSLVAFNNAGSTISSNAVLTVLTPATITLHPTNQNVLPGTNVTLVAFAVGTGPVRYQWRFEGTNILNATNASYSFTGASITNHGNFSVVATDDNGTTVSSNAFIYVLIRPGIVTHIISQTVLQGGTAIFSVVATGAPPLWYRWIRNGTGIQTSTVPVLILTNVQASATIRVVVTNAANPAGVFSPASGTASLTVLADFDHDGIADIWEAAYFGNSSTNDPSNALLDPDGDGMINRDEYVAGTDPTNALSVLKIVLTATNANVLQFVAQTNVTYSVQCRPNLSTAAWTNLTNIFAQTGVRTILVDTALSPPSRERYYRVVTPLVP